MTAVTNKRQPHRNPPSASSAPSLLRRRPQQHKQRRYNNWDCLSMSLFMFLLLLVLIYARVLITIMSSSQDSSRTDGKTNHLASSSVRGHGVQPKNQNNDAGRLSSDFVLNNLQHRHHAIDESGLRFPLLGIRRDILGDNREEGVDGSKENDAANDHRQPSDKDLIHTDGILRTYLEPIHQEDWEIKPLPIRKTTADQLTVIEHPGVNSCSNLMEQFPANDYNDADPFLPWIHDVFPTHDGKFIQFVAQNRRRCNTGKNDDDILQHQQPQAALFQHVPVKRMNGGRYRLSTHEEADPDGVATRFICRFKPSGDETLSVQNFNYEFAAYRKRSKSLFTKEGRDIKSIYTSQLLFQCPVPESLQKTVRDGTSVKNDFATLFVDLIPIRTPPRYGLPDEFLPLRYKEHESTTHAFNAAVEYGTSHVLPSIEDSGRWENLPICKPSLLEYEPNAIQPKEEKSHRLVACVWASAAYTTRGERFSINDGQRRLYEWLKYQFLIGFEHVYVYDNSLAHTNETSLKAVTDLFPNKVTRVVWPAKVCNNRPNNVDSPGERSSQYAAEASCKLRFGTHAEWLGGFDIDEYLVPLGKHTSVTTLLDDLEREKKKIISFASWRAWPRKKYIEEPVMIEDRKVCGRTNMPCFELKVQQNHTILQTYNCDRQKGQKKTVMPAEKQLYKPDYVKLHFVHYSTITELAQLSKSETEKAGLRWMRRINEDPASRFSDEVNEATMLHTKAVATKDTAGWMTACKHSQGFCRIGNPYPPGALEANVTEDENGWTYNCFVNDRVEDYWVPKLEAEGPFLPWV